MKNNLPCIFKVHIGAYIQAYYIISSHIWTFHKMLFILSYLHIFINYKSTYRLFGNTTGIFVLNQIIMLEKKWRRPNKNMNTWQFSIWVLIHTAYLMPWSWQHFNNRNLEWKTHPNDSNSRYWNLYKRIMKNLLGFDHHLNADPFLSIFSRVQ